MKSSFLNWASAQLHTVWTHVSIFSGPLAPGRGTEPSERGSLLQVSLDFLQD